MKVMKVFMMKIENNMKCFVRLWRLLEHTRLYLDAHYKRFCVRHVLILWFKGDATDDFIWEVCNKTVVNEETVCGWDLLPLPSLFPRQHRELLRAIVAVRLDIGMRKVDLKALDAAYSIVFPHSTPINVSKK